MSYTLHVSDGTTNRDIAWDPNSGARVDISGWKIPKSLESNVRVTSTPNGATTAGIFNDRHFLTALEMEEGPGGGGS